MIHNSDALTPTVKLNGLAMKRGEMAIYKILDRKPMYNNYQNNSQVNFCLYYCNIFRSYDSIKISLVSRKHASNISK